MSLPSHFQGKEAVEHVVEAQARGIVTKAEAHGEEIPGHISAFADSLKEAALVLLLLLSSTLLTKLPTWQLIAFGAAYTLWRGGRSAWLGWARLERLHRIAAEEKWEIDHHRDQEREELKALYAAKGFSGKLLDDVMDVLMADGDRLLRVMLEEELGLTLENQEHPLKQGLFSLIGAALAIFLFLLALILSPLLAAAAAGALIAIASGLTARYDRNRIIPAVVWNLGLAILASGVAYFLSEGV